MIKIDSQKVIQHLQNKWKAGCPYCQQSDFSVEHCLYSLKEAKDPDSTIEPTNFVPMVVVCCNDC
ncbi:hypothetical protein MJH12_04640, partial [bacterium]|nr:hypothetical protein [bacterium]